MLNLGVKGHRSKIDFCCCSSLAPFSSYNECSIDLEDFVWIGKKKHISRKFMTDLEKKKKRNKMLILYSVRGRDNELMVGVMFETELLPRKKMYC